MVWHCTALHCTALHCTALHWWGYTYIPALHWRGLDCVKAPGGWGSLLGGHGGRPRLLKKVNQA